MSGEFPAYNLVDALASEARNAMQLFKNLEYTSGNGILGGGSAPAWARNEWPTADHVYYEADGYPVFYARLQGIYMARTGDVEWLEEEVHDRVVDVAYERVYNVPAGVRQEVEYDFTLGAVRTRESATSVGLENEIGVRLGGINTPAGATNNSTVKLAVEKKYGETHTFEQRFADKTIIEGPADLILRGERSRAQVSQVVKAVPEFEYKLILGMIEGGIGYGQDHRYYREVAFDSKAQFNAFIQGRASDDVGVVYQYTALVTRDRLRTWPMASVAREHRQPDTVITPHHLPLTFTAPFDDQINQGVTFYDGRTGEKIDPATYKPDGDNPAINVGG